MKPFHPRLPALVLALLFAACDIGGGGGTTVTVDSGTPPDTPTVQVDGACTPQCAGRQCGDDGCGGSCGSCGDGIACDAASGICAGTCTADCAGKVCGSDGCGGSCGDCDAGATCVGGQCESAASCIDGKTNGNETDVDCGGGCPEPCGVGKHCLVPADCATGDCGQGACWALPTCENNAKDPGETDVDCGGKQCPACPLTKFCADHTDCLSLACIFGMCKEPACDDGTRNQDETDVDCGGSCPACADGRYCDGGGDCLSGSCAGGVCISCSDGKKNGTETDPDCGGSCKKCYDGKHCLKPSDCSSGACEGGTCCSPNACGQCTTTPEEVCDGKDNDCDGQTDEASQIGTPPPCPLQAGVCAGSKAACKGGSGWLCDDATYTKHSGDFQATEAACDGRDNDCDGTTDEGLANACGTCGAVPVERCNGVDDDCDGQTDEIAACAACNAHEVRTIADSKTSAAAGNSVARADDAIWAAYTSGYNLTLVQLVDGDLGTKQVNGTVWNPNDGARAPQIRSDGTLLYTAYRTSQLNGACAKTTSAGSQQASTLWSLHSDTPVETPRLAVGPKGAAVLYRSMKWNGDYNVTTWHIGFYGKAGGWSSTEITSWYSEYVGSAAELAVLPDGEVLLLNTVGVSAFSYRTSKDDYSTEHAIDDFKPSVISSALGTDGTLHVVTSAYAWNGYETRYRTLTNGTWSTVETIGTFGDPMIALDLDGKLHVAGTDDLGVGVWTRTGGAWNKVAGCTFDEGCHGIPGLAVDASGRYHVTLTRTGYSPPLYGFYYVMLCPALD